MEKDKREKKFISLVVYLHNVENEIKIFLQNVIPYMEEKFEQFEIICVNDGCTDRTIEVLKEYSKGNNISAMMNIVHMSFFHGLESSMNAGRDLAIGDFIYEFDNISMDYPKQILEEAYGKVLEGNDIVGVGPEDCTSFSSKIFYNIFNKTSKGRGTIGPETFRVLSRRAINRVKSIGQYIPYRKAMYANCGLQTYKILYKPTIRTKKSSNISRGERATLALDSFVYFTNVLERVSALMCGAFLCFSIGMGIYIVKDYYSGVAVVEGWMSTMGFLSLGFFGVFALLTIILKYLSVMLNLIFKQQRYLIADVEKVANMV